MSARGFVSNLIRQSPLRWHVPNKLSRIDVIQRAIDALGAKTYLEIGVSLGECFCAVRVPRKIGVDLIPPAPAVVDELRQPGASYEQMTSDEFFATRAAAILGAGLDVVFVDGLHTYGQTLRDCENSLRFLNPGGIIFVHDCLPISAAQACPADSYDEALRLNGPEWDGLWTGDGWKTIIRMRARHDDVQAAVLNCDHGIGVIWRGEPSHLVALSASEVDALTYEDLTVNAAQLLGLRSPAAIGDILKECAQSRATACAF